MKRFNWNIIVFIVSMVFIAAGLFSKQLALGLKDTALSFVSDIKAKNASSVKNMIASVDKALMSPSYHDQMMDLNSVRDRLFNTRIITKDGTPYVRSASDSIFVPAETKISFADSENPSKVLRLMECAEENGAVFLYCVAPSKDIYEEAPENIENYGSENYLAFVNAFKRSGVPVLDLNDALIENGFNQDEMFFSTDHHWKPQAGFVAAGAIVDYLHDRYGFDYDEYKCDLTNYNIETLHDFFLGSYGKKTGAYFLPSGPDDIDIITPDFPTDFVEERPFKDERREGDFSETVMFMNNVSRKAYYELNPYAVYSGGDFRLQIIKNNLLPEGKKLLIIRDSYACCVTPFLSLHFSELDIVDTRSFGKFVGDKINVFDYIRETSPDYVIILYNGVQTGSSSGRFDFE